MKDPYFRIDRDHEDDGEEPGQRHVAKHDQQTGK